MIDLENARQAFYTYLKDFDHEDDKIRLKIVHTDGVVASAKEITRRMGLNEEDCKLAELIALLHDIGRFEQLRLYDSFDHTMMDHALFGVEMLFGEDMMIRQFVEEDCWDEIIKEAIGRHSDYAVGEGLNERTLMHAKIIRDADKLDNCRVKLVDSMQTLLDCDEVTMGAQKISDGVWEECMAHTCVHLDKREDKIDYWVSYLAYFFDINYAATAEIILERDYPAKIMNRIIYSNVETKQKMLQLCDMTSAYLKALKMTAVDKDNLR